MGKTSGIEVYLRVRPTKKPFKGLGMLFIKFILS